MTFKVGLVVVQCFYMTYYSSAIVSMALSCTIFELFDVQKYHDLKIRVKGHLRSFKLVPFESLGMVSYSQFTLNMAVSLAVCEISSILG